MAAIETHALVKRFGATTALDGIDLVVPERCVFGLIGPNGAGKTTTFSILCGFVHPTGGSAQVLGKHVRQIHELKGRVGALPQDALLPPHESVGASLVYYGRLLGWTNARAKDEAHAALERTGLQAWAHQKPSALSHGMAKRVGIAQAFLGVPELVLLDEPTAGLDPAAAAQVRQLIQALRADRTVVVSSHNLHELEELCDHAAILSHGKIVQQGPMSEVTAQNSELRFQLGATPPLPEIEALACVASASWEPARETLLVRSRAASFAPEQVIASVLGVLLAKGTPIRGVAKGKKLEERVIELTSARATN